MPAAIKSPDQRYVACQSLDNKIVVFDVAGGKFRPKRKKTFQGHLVAGYACVPTFSPDMSYICSGDGEGKVFIWDWKTGKLYSKFRVSFLIILCTYMSYMTYYVLSFLPKFTENRNFGP